MSSKQLQFGLIALFAFLLFWAGNKMSSPRLAQRSLEGDSFFNYVIPKLKHYIPKFSLWDRKFVDRRKLAPKSPEAAKKANAKPSATPSPSPVPKAKAIASATPTPVPKPGMEVTTVGSPLDGSKEPFDPAFNDPYRSGGVNSGGLLPTETPSPETLVGEWRMRLLRNPTKDAMNDFVFEFQTGKVKKDVFYQVIEELLRDSNPDIQRLAVYGLSATPSYDSLFVLLTNKDQLANETQSAVRLAMDGYVKPDKLSLIAMSLRSNSPPVVIGSMPLVIKISKKVQLWSLDQSSTLDDRDRRGPTTGVPKKGFIEVVKILRELSESSDRPIAQAAQDTLNRLTISDPIARRRD